VRLPICYAVSSLKKHLDSDRNELLISALDSYRATLVAMGNSGAQACPHLGTDMQQSLLSLQNQVSTDATPELVAETQQRVEEELRRWGDSAAEYFKSKAAEVRELMMVLARMAEAVGERDYKYNRQFSDFQSRLHAIADLEDLTKIRGSLLQSALELKTCVDKMAQDSQESVTQLQSELSRYQRRLHESERLASMDPLTGLDNRRKVELEARAAAGRKFCIVMFDLNDFKQINDQMGHLAGDQILKQFATEQRSAIRAGDIVGRWGGDEFLAIVDCDLAQANAQLARIREWVLGEYSIATRGGARKVSIEAAIGVAESQAGESVLQALERADAAMYRDKGRSKGRGA
jgi:diguanylate cyclase (GGDEF)-like protein